MTKLIYGKGNTKYNHHITVRRVNRPDIKFADFFEHGNYALLDYVDSKASPNFDSGYFSVSVDTAYKIVHRLGYIPYLIIIYFSTDPNPSDNIPENEGESSKIQMDIGYRIYQMKKNSFFLRTPSSLGSGGNTSGYYRVVIW